jgi:hypothetical protein
MSLDWWDFDYYRMGLLMLELLHKINPSLHMAGDDALYRRLPLD